MWEHLHELYPDRPFIGFCGSADERGEGIERFVDGFVSRFGGDFVGVCGGTEVGVPGIVGSALSRLGVPVVGVVPVRGEHKFGAYVRHRVSVVPRCGDSCWGDESEVLVKLCDVIVFFGGGWGTMIELSHAMKINQLRIVNGEPPIGLVLLTSFSGVLASVVDDIPPAHYVFFDGSDYDPEGQSLCAPVARFARMIRGLHV